MTALANPSAGLARIGFRVGGRVQGVGFRPFVCRLARELALDGWVRNDGSGVEMEVEGPVDRLSHFRARLYSDLPPMARIERLDEEPRAPASEPGFAIVASQTTRVRDQLSQIAPDAAVCGPCLEEIFHMQDRRYRYAFTSCSDCGPRYTIAKSIPYDRPNTAMAGFAMCPSCAAEYASPAHRRFHAQTNACPRCGPQLALLDAQALRASDADPVCGAWNRIRAGGIIAVKGLGGFHLVGDARNGATVARLRERKHREEKPLAVMVANCASLGALAHFGEDEARLLGGVEAPIVLLRKQATCDTRLPGIAPGIAWLGVMLPNAPLDWLLFHEAAGRPAGARWREQVHDLVLVVTSANARGEPIVASNAEAIEKLAGIADAFLVHDRDIVARCDDSVLRVADRSPAFVRRARGYTPAPIRLDADGPSVLAFGGHLKNTVCVTRGCEAFVSQHLGDLDSAAARHGLEQTVERLLAVLDVRPQRVACDLHPDYYSTRLARGFAERHDLPVVAVQHHHAHLAAVAAEHRASGPLLGLALDGHGYGADGQAWGGELLLLEASACTRLASLRPLPLPGGDRAARDPWRMAVAASYAMGVKRLAERVGPPSSGAPQRLLDALHAGLSCASTSSAGRLFDAAAGLLGVQAVTSFEGQAAMRLEGLAARYGPATEAPRAFVIDERGELDFRPVLAELAQCPDPAAGAARFHASLAAGFAAWLAGASERLGVRRVVLGGGCFLNDVLRQELCARLRARGLTVLTAHLVPPNDGGLALGQAWVARQAQLLSREKATCA
jgi:hydrogenase maturation protein HypF